jgi:hypothetical protein
MCMTPKEHVLRCAGESWPYFNKKPYTIDHFFKIVEREGIDLGIFSINAVEYDELDHYSFEHDKWIFVNGCGSVFHQGDILVFDYSKLFHWYYINEPGFLNFHNCLVLLCQFSYHFNVYQLSDSLLVDVEFASLPV